MAINVEEKFRELGQDVEAAKIAADNAKTAVNNLGAAVNAIPASIAGSTQVKEAMKEAVERSNIGSNVSDAKATAEATKVVAEATKTAVEAIPASIAGSTQFKEAIKEAVEGSNIPRDINLPSDVIQALKEEIRNTVRAEITAQGIDDSAIRTAVAEMRQAVDALRLNAGAFDVEKILKALDVMDKRLSSIERNAKLAAFTPDAAKQALNDAYVPFQRAEALPG